MNDAWSAGEPWTVDERASRARRLAAVARAGAGSAGRAAAAAAGRARGAAGRTAVRTKDATIALRASTRDVIANLPPEARQELRGSLWRLRKVRSPASAAAAFEREVGVLLRLVTPVLVEHPLPVHRAGTARAVVAGSAALAAAGEQAEAIAALFSAGATIPGTVPLALAAVFLSLVVELYVALSLRVHDLRAAGAPIDPDAVAAEVTWAMAGAGGRPQRAWLTRRVVQKLTLRMLARWGRGLVPIAGTAYSGWDAQRTIGAMRTLDVPRPPTRVPPRALPAGADRAGAP